jgi:hypothetical protein
MDVFAHSYFEGLLVFNIEQLFLVSSFIGLESCRQITSPAKTCLKIHRCFLLALVELILNIRILVSKCVFLVVALHVEVSLLPPQNFSVLFNQKQSFPVRIRFKHFGLCVLKLVISALDRHL